MVRERVRNFLLNSRLTSELEAIEFGFLPIMLPSVPGGGCRATRRCHLLASRLMLSGDSYRTGAFLGVLGLRLWRRNPSAVHVLGAPPGSCPHSGRRKTERSPSAFGPTAPSLHFAFGEVQLFAFGEVPFALWAKSTSTLSWTSPKAK